MKLSVIYGREFVFQQITLSEFCSALKELHVNKSPGPDHIAPLFLKLAADFISPPFTYIVNLSLITNTIPMSRNGQAPLPPNHNDHYHLSSEHLHLSCIQSPHYQPVLKHTPQSAHLSGLVFTKWTLCLRTVLYDTYPCDLPPVFFRSSPSPLALPRLQHTEVCAPPTCPLFSWIPVRQDT